MRLVLVGTNHDRLAALAGDLGLQDDRWLPAVGDLREPLAASDVVAATTERYGRLDILLHLVGGWAGGTPVMEIDPTELGGMLDQHLWTTLHVAKASVPVMVTGGWGVVIAVSSPVAAEPGPRAASYAIAKAAEEVLLRTLAREVGSNGVTANLVVVRAIDAKHERETAPSPKNASWTTPEEIAAAMILLCSPGADTINGVRIPLFGRS